MATLKELQEEMKKLFLQIDTVLSVSNYRDYDDLSNIEYSTNNADDLLLLDKYRSILYKLSDLQYELVLFEDIIIRRPDGRFGTRNNKTYYTCGNCIEFLINVEVLGDDGYFTVLPAWRISTIEHDGKDYFIAGYKDVDLNGLKVRLRNRY